MLRAHEIIHKFHNRYFPKTSPWLAGLLAFFLLFLSQETKASPKFSIVWSTETHTGATNYLKDSSGQALDAGTAMNGDGYLVEIGYFSEGSFSSPFQENAFLGEWIPLTVNTRVGDSSSGYGFPDGMFTFKTTFTKDANFVTTFWGEPKYFTDYLEDDITANSPPPQTTPVCIRFYNSTNKLGSLFNTVSGPDWKWPSFPNGSSIPTTSYFKIAPGNAPPGSFWVHGSTFEDPDNSFKTSISPQYEISLVVLDGPGTGKVGFGSDIDQNITNLVRSFGDSVTINALPNLPHSEFMGWVGTGITDPYNKTTTLTVNGDQKEIYAEFFTIPYLLSMEVIGDGEVFANGQNTPLSFSYDDNVTISAVPYPGYSFQRWEKDGIEISSNQQTSVNIQGDTELVAIFSRNQYQVNVGATEGGSYEILDTNESMPSSFGHGLNYTLRALPDPHYGFSSWYSTPSGLSMLDNQSFAQTTFIPTSDVNYTAIFSELNYKLNIESTQGYSSLTDSGQFPALSMIEVEVQTADGFVFDYWLDPMGILTDPNSWQTEANMSRIYPYTEASISAVLRLDDYDQTDVNITSDFGGNIFSESDENGGFTHFKLYELNATSILGYQFDQWVGDVEQLQAGPSEPINQVLIEGPLSLRATYQLSEYKIDLSSLGDGDTVGPESFTISDTPSIKAVAFPGWRFTHWTGDTDFLLDHFASETFIPLESNSVPKDLSFTANFIPKNYDFQLNTTGNGTVDIYLSNGDAFDGLSSHEFSSDSQTQITLEAFAADGWNFKTWMGLPDLSELLNPVAYIDPYSSLSYFYPSKDLNITAIFEVKEYDDQEIAVRSGIGGSISVESEDNDKFLHFSSYDLNASPSKGYEFSQWITDPTKENFLSNGIYSANNILTIGGEIEINATFSTVVFNLSINTDEGGTTTGSSTFTVLDTPVIQATPSDGWDFSHWSGDVEYLSDPNAQIATINHSSLELKSLSFTANFVREVYQITLDSEGSGSFEIFKNNMPHFPEDASQALSIDSATRIGINALPISGWKFAQWFGLPNPNDLRDPSPSLNQYSANINFIPVEDSNVTAQFVRQKYALDIPSPEIGGSTTTGGIFAFESIVEINASAQHHFLFEEWVGDTNQLLYPSTLPNNKIIIPDSNLTVQAIFKPKIYSLYTNPNEDGYYEISGTYDEITQSNQSEYNATASVTVSALPNNPETHMLSHLYWENSLGESGYLYSSTLTLSFLDGNYSFWSSFVPRNEIGYTLYSTPPYGGAAGEDSAYSSAQFQKLIANPNLGFSFLGWSSETGNSFAPHWTLHSTESALDENDELWANFAPQSKFLSLQYDEVKGTVSGFTEQVTYGDYLNLTASPKENYAFAGWELRKEVHFQITKDFSSVDPTFSRIFVSGQESPELNLIRGFTYYFDCNLSAEDGFFLSTSPDSEDTSAYYLSGVTGHLTSNQVLTFSVPADAPSTLYYHSSEHSYSGNIIRISDVSDSSLLSNGANPVLNQRVTQHFGLTANFERTKHTLAMSASGQGDVNFTPQDTYFWGDTIEISATSEEHWYFSHWEGNANLTDENSANTEFSISGDTEIRAIFKKVQYQIDINASPADYGITNQLSETYSYGDFVTLTATPLIGKQFDQWAEIENLSLNSTEDRFNETATFQVLGNAKVQANFSKIPINLNIEMVSLDQNNNPIIGDIGGTINVPSSIHHGDTVNLDLNLSDGYTLLQWLDLDTGVPLSDQKNLSFSATSDRNIKVLLRKLHYQLDISQNTGGSTTINTNSPFYWRDQIEIYADPDIHWEFFRWSGVGSENLSNQYSPLAVLTIEKDTSIQAEFQKKGYALLVNADPTGYGGFSSLENSYNFGDNVTIRANPREGKIFDKWNIESNATFAEDSNSSSNPASFIIQGNARISAAFKSKQYSVAYQVVVFDENDVEQEDAFGGRIIGGKSFADEDIAEFIVSLSNGYQLKHWQIENETPEIKSTDQIYQHQMDGDLNLTAVVTQRKYEVDVSVTPTGGGYATLNDYVVSNQFSQNEFSYGADINLTASPYEGFRFVKWSATGTNLSSPNQPNQSFNIGNDAKLTAYFAPTGKVSLTLNSSPTEASSYIYGAGEFDYSPDHAILTLAKEGYLFSYWEYNGTIAEGIVRDPYSSTTSITLDGDKVLTAVFRVDPDAEDTGGNSDEKFLLSVYSKNTNRGTTSGSGFFRGIRTIKAFPKSGYEFSHWEGATLLDAYAAITEVGVYANTSVVAHFQSIGLFDDSEELDNGWWGNPWFGYFWKVGEEDWLFHEKLGWIFMKKKGDNSIWVWIQKLEDWFWTAKDHYPYLHSSSTQTWYFLNLDQSNYNQLIIYNYQESRWESL